MKKQSLGILAVLAAVCASFPAWAAASVWVQLQEPANGGQQKALAVFSRVVKERTGLDSAATNNAPLIFGFRSDIGAEGFSIEDGPDKTVKVLGNGLPGLMAGVGKLLRTARLEAGVFEPGAWRGVSVPACPVRGIYFATHFFNWYHVAPIEDVKRYVEDLALWGCNTISVWFDMHHYQGIDDPKAQEILTRLREILKASQEAGLEPALTTLANEAYASSPKELRAEWALQNGYVKNLSHYHVEVCPNKPGGMDYLLQTRRSVLEAFRGTGLKYIWMWPYDQGGCTCDACAPWAAKGFLKASKGVAELTREMFPGAKTVLATWHFDLYFAVQTEWPAFYAALGGQAPAWLDYLMVDERGDRPFPDYPVSHGAPGGLPMVNFPEISMFNNAPWGGYGANPTPARMATSWAAAKGMLKGGWPYSEGIFEDINKCVALQLYWSGQAPAETVKEYMAYEFAPEAADALTAVATEMEQSQSHFCILPKKDSQPLSSVLYAEPAPVLYHTSRLGDAASRLQRVEQAAARLEPKARSSWRWRILYLRAKIDAELQRSGGRPNETLDRCFEELNKIYYAGQAINLLRPPSRKALLDLNRGAGKKDSRVGDGD